MILAAIPKRFNHIGQVTDEDPDEEGTKDEDDRSRHGRDVEDIPAPAGEREPPSSITRGVSANIAIFAPDKSTRRWNNGQRS